MKRFLMLFVLALTVCQWASAQRFTDSLGRGLVAVPVGAAGSSTANMVSWRRLANEYYGVTYNLYKNGTKIASGLTTTCYNDERNAPTSTKYMVAPVVNGVEQEKCAEVQEVQAWSNGNAYKPNGNDGPRYAYGYLYIALATVFDRDHNDVTANYMPNDAEVADLDGDGEMEIIIKRLNTVDAAPDANGEIYTTSSKQFVVIDAYDVNWQTGAATLMWRIDCGPNMVSMNSTEINIIAYDWNEDGKAEVVLRGADNMIVYGSDGWTRLHTIGDMTVNTRNDLTSHKDAQYAWTHTGAEYLIYMNGQTGQLYQVIDYPLTRENANAWGQSEGYGHRSSKYFFGAPFLDGRKASLFMARGIYARHKMIAMDLDRKTNKWSTLWTWNNNTNGSPWYGNGYHNFVIADVDEDGRDEIVYGSMVIDDKGNGLSTTGLGHGDAQHVGDFDPYRQGLEFFGCNEDKPAMNYRNATTSEIYYRQTASEDDGRCLIGNFSSTMPGCLGRSVSTGLISSVKDAVVADSPTGNNDGLFWSHLNFRIYWDGDLGDEILDSPGTEGAPAVWDHENGRIFVSRNEEGCGMNNDSKNNPCFQGDIIGDWREEIIVRHGTGICVYTTGISTDRSMPSLWFDHQYRQAMVWQMMAYNQPPHPSYFMGEMEGITQAPPPLTNQDRTEIGKDGTIGTGLNGKHVLICDNKSSASSFTIAEGAQPAVITVNTPKWVQGHDDNNNITTTYYQHTLKGAALTGSTRLTKQGGGTLKLNKKTHTYTGATDVWGGTLEFDGTLQNSALWLNRFTTLRSTGGNFGAGITADYGSTIIPGGEDTQGAITTTALTLNHGARLLLDVYTDLTADQVNATTLTVNTMTGEAWQNYGPKYLKPVIQIVAHGTLPNGTYDLGTVGSMTGSTDDIVLEGISDATLAYTEGHLCLVVGNGIATFCDDANIAESSMQATNEGILMPVVNVTANSFQLNTDENATPILSASFTDLQGMVTEVETAITLYNQDYEQETDASKWVTQYATLELASDNTYGKYIKVNQNGNAGSRSAHTDFYTNSIYTNCSSYILEFDAYFHHTNGDYDPNELILYGEGAKTPYSNAMFSSTNYLFKMTGGKNYSTTYTVEGTASSFTLADDAWYHYSIYIDKDNKRITYKITNNKNVVINSGSYVITDNTVSLNTKGMHIGLGRAWSYAGVDNINIVSKDHFTYAFTEPGTLTVASSYEGCATKRTPYEVEFVGAQIGTVGWTTLGCRYPLVLSSDALTEAGLEAAYIVSEPNTNSVTLSAVQSVPAYTGLLMKGASSTYRLPIATSPADVNTNLLVAVTNVEGFTVSSDDVYVLAKKNAGLGFYPCAQGVTVPAGKAYLTLPGPARSFVGFSDGDTTNGISQDATCTVHDAQVVYDLQGRKIESLPFANRKLPKGIYISGNRKVIVK